MNQNKREIRTINAQEFRSAKTDKGTTISGTAIVYDSLSEDLGGFREKIAQGAVRASLESNDVLCLFSHDHGKVLGRTSAKTLSLREDAAGVHFECLLPENSVGNDLEVSMARGDINQCSFGFFCDKDSWKNAADGTGWVRTVEQANVFEVTVCASPAYGATSAQVNRALFPDGLPAEIRAHVPEVTVVIPPVIEERAANSCDCQCAECLAGDCADCSDPDCDDEFCDNTRMNGLRSLRLRARLIALNK